MVVLPLLRRRWLGGIKGIRPVKTEWRGAGMVICLERGADLPSWCHCHSLSFASVKSRLVLPFWYRLTQVVLDKGPLNGCISTPAILYRISLLALPAFSVAAYQILFCFLDVRVVPLCIANLSSKLSRALPLSYFWTIFWYVIFENFACQKTVARRWTNDFISASEVATLWRCTNTFIIIF